MTAMTGAPDAAGFGNRLFGGCYGSCYGSACYSSCYGTSCLGASYSCTGCCGGFGSVAYSCSGCYGGPLFPRLSAAFSGFGDRLRYAFAPIGSYACTGCCGGSAACYGSCFGCCGGSCIGSCTGCFGGGVYYGSAVYGGCYGTSCAGCIGGGCVGVPLVGAAGDLPAVPVAAAPAVPVEHASLKPAGGDPSAASLLVSLPAAAKLYVDGQLVPGDGSARRFHTPPLTAGQSFYYELKAEVLVAGKVETEEAKVVVRAGDSKDVGFPRLTAAAAQVTGSLAAR
jgi:uncharacterized protein (TIGR03000 family)